MALNPSFSLFALPASSIALSALEYQNRLPTKVYNWIRSSYSRYDQEKDQVQNNEAKVSFEYAG
jgi:hypothetical protein